MCLFCKQYAYLLSPCLTESACRSKSVEIKGWGKWLCFSWFTQPSEAGWQRRRRRRHAELQRSEVVWERPPCTRRRTRATAPDKEDPPPHSPRQYCTRLHEKALTHARGGARSNTHSLRRHWASGEFSYTYAWWGGRRGKGLVGKWDACSRSVQHRIQLVCQVVKHAANVVQDGDCCFFSGERAGSWARIKEGFG